MKKSLLVIAVAAFFAACNDKGPLITAPAIQQVNDLPDTIGLAEFNRAKEQQQMVELQGVEIETEQEVKEQAPRIVYRSAPAVKKTTTVRYKQPVPSNTGSNTQTSHDPYEGNKDSKTSIPDIATQPTVGDNTGAANEDVVATTPEPQKNKGWSKAAKGTAIGAGSGAVLGAIISKNKTKGAVIGGVIGAAGGYVLGKKMDKKAESNEYLQVANQ